MSRSSDEKPGRSAKSAGRAVRSAGHSTSGGHHGPHNRFRRELNTLEMRNESKPVAFQEYPKRIAFEDGSRARALHAEHEAELRAAYDAGRPSGDDAEKAAIREKLAALNVPAPHHKTGLDKLRALLADAGAAAAPQPTA